MTAAITLATLAHTNLVQQCRRESQRFFQHQPNDPTFCYELFRRAMIGRDQAAWSAIYDQYTPLALGWVERHASFAGCEEESLYFVNRAFEKMWSALSPEKFSRFPDLKSLLRYLQLCIHSVIIDYARTAQQVELAEPTGSWQGLESDVLAEMARGELWQRIGTHLTDKREKQLLYYRYALGLKPREICNRFADEFPEVGEIYVMNQNILARLRRDDALRQFFVDEFLPS